MARFVSTLKHIVFLPSLRQSEQLSSLFFVNVRVVVGADLAWESVIAKVCVLGEYSCCFIRIRISNVKELRRVM